ncbi:MAG TPA: hypothetical protein VNN80_26085, partial [Polyangiaceae bacterium]|nr:hypothetical protein [Polyangiaceae bacterium]
MRKRCLAPLSPADVGAMLRDTLGGDTPDLGELVGVVSEKTLGNPYFLRVFLSSLAERGILTFDAGWHWQLARARALPATDNVVSLLCDRIQHLPEETREVLEHAAILGGSVSFEDLELSSGIALMELLRRLAPAIAADLVRLEAAQMHFQHDRVQEAACAMIGAEHLPERHWDVGRLWQKCLPPSVLDDRVFELVGHLNAARELLGAAERIELGRMNLNAVGKAKRSGAIARARELARQGLSSLDASARQREYTLYFELSLEHADLTFCGGDFATSEALCKELRQLARRPIDEAAALGILLKQYVVQARFDEAIETAREALALVGVELPTEARRVQEKLREERPRTDRLLAGRSPHDLFASPEMRDPAARLALELLVRVTAAIFFHRPDMLQLDIVLMANLSLEYGNTPASAFAYVELGYLWTLEDRERGPAYAFAELGLQLAEHFGDPIQYCRAAHIAAWIQHHVRHHREAEPIYRRGFAAGSESGESEWAAYHCYLRAARILLLGEELEGGQREMERLRQYVERVSSHSIVELLDSLQRHIADLTRSPSDTQHEAKTAELIASWEAVNKQAVFIYRSFRAFTLLVEQRYAEALAHAETALALSIQAPAHPFVQLAHFARGLASLAQLDVGQPIPDAALEELEYAKRASRDCAPNYAAELELLEAELGRVRGEGWANGERYDAARRLAALHGFVQEEGLADQLAARFWRNLGCSEFALACLRRARSCWARWGASYPEQLLARELAEQSRGGESHSDMLDFQSILKSIQAISA